MLCRSVLTHCLRLCLLTIAAGSLCSCAAVRPTKTVRASRQFDYDGRILAGPADRGLALAISQPNIGEPVIDIMLKNEGQRRLCINGRFVLDLGQYDASPTLAVLVERASSGERVPVSRSTWTSGGRQTDAGSFKYLEPHEYYTSRVNLQNFFDLRRGEQYRVSVEYFNQDSGYTRGGWVEMYAWVGRIRSNALLLR